MSMQGLLDSPSDSGVKLVLNQDVVSKCSPHATISSELLGHVAFHTNVLNISYFGPLCLCVTVLNIIYLFLIGSWTAILLPVSLPESQRRYSS